MSLSKELCERFEFPIRAVGLLKINFPLPSWASLGQSQVHRAGMLGRAWRDESTKRLLFTMVHELSVMATCGLT